MTPTYISGMFPNLSMEYFLHLPWEQHRPTRKECFMSDPHGVSYTYGKGPSAETYISIKMEPIIVSVMNMLNCNGDKYNGCFLNLYEDDKHHLGWHADDFEGMDKDHPIASVSFGQSREIWWRENGFTGVIPVSNRQMLEHGSVFIMPAGFQEGYQHRIPKGDRAMGPRVSLTFRRFI